MVGRAVAGKCSHPILNNVLFTADVGTQRVSLTGFDLSLGIQTSFLAEVEISGAVAIPAKLLTDIVTLLPDTDILLSLTEAGEVVLQSAAGKYKVRGMDATEFPQLPLVESDASAKVLVSSLLSGIRGTLFAVSTDNSKQILMGVNLSVRDEMLEFAGTDGHRLAVVSAEYSGPDIGFAVPARTLREMERMISAQSPEDSIALYFDGGQVVFQWGDQIITSRTLDGQYPNYPQLIPQQFERQVTLDRKLLVSALERIAVLADQKNNVVKLTFSQDEQTVMLSVEAQDVGSGQESLPAQVSGESLEIAFNVKYLMDGLKALPSSEIQIQLNNETRPVVLTPLGGVSLLYMVMPIQIRG